MMLTSDWLFARYNRDYSQEAAREREEETRAQVSCDWSTPGHVITILTSDWFRWPSTHRRVTRCTTFGDQRKVAQRRNILCGALNNNILA